MKKNTIAFFTRSLIDATGSNMWQGIVNECRNDKIPVVTFRGPILNQGAGSIIYHLVEDSDFAGVISWASSDVTPEAVDFYNRFQKTPLLCMTFHIPGHPVILTDCKTGEKELISHLIEVHNIKKIAFIRGPALHVYAKDRYEGYLEALQEHGIPIDERLISPPGGWAISDGAKAINEFMNNGLTPGLDFEAVVAVGDNVSIGAQEELQKKGFLVPQNVVVCGYNGTNDAACCNPPITTVEMPFFGQGKKAYETIKDIIEGREVPEEFKYSTKLIIGESCGCTSYSVKRASLQNIQQITKKKSSIFNKEDFDYSDIQRKLQDFNWQREMNEKVKQSVSSSRYGTAKVVEFFGSITNDLTKKICDNIMNIAQNKSEFVNALSNYLSKYIKISKDLILWQDIISEYRETILSFCADSPIIIKLETIFQQARILINEIDARTQKLSSLMDTRYESQLRLTSSSLLSSYDIPELMNILTKSLPKLNIKGMYVALYNDCHYSEENQQVPETSKLILAIRDGKRIDLENEEVDFPTHQIVPDEYLPESNFYSLVVESLHFQNTYIGYIVFQHGTEETGVAYTALRDQLSSSLYGALILQKLNENKIILERTMQTMSTKADVVSNQANMVSGNLSMISDSMGSVANNIKEISGNIETVTNTVNATDTMITEANISIAHLVESTNKIANAVHMINDIAERTNVLALNASIEASHAGDAGRGFSVVAREVKALAAQTVNSTQAIQELVARNTENSAITEKLINDTNNSIKTISSLSENIKQSINAQVQSSAEISSQLTQATTGSNEISSAITEIAKLGENLTI